MELSIPSLVQPSLRDLYWALYSAPLFGRSDQPGVDLCQAGLGDGRSPGAVRRVLRGWDHADSPFVRDLSQRRDRRLGTYFEALLAAYLRHDPAYDLLAQGQPIRAGGRTVGEIDLLYREQATGEVVHLEVAVKFYLSVQGQPDWADWVGPNPTDRLDRKWPRMQAHQATLLQQPAGRAWLAARGWPQPVSRVLIKGATFVHAKMPGRVIPDRAYAQHIQGRWLRRSEAAAYLPHMAPWWQPLPRLAWLAAAAHLPPTTGQRPAQWLAQVGQRPVQARAWDESGQQPGLRLMLVPDHWPGLPPRR